MSNHLVHLIEFDGRIKELIDQGKKNVSLRIKPLSKSIRVALEVEKDDVVYISKSNNVHTVSPGLIVKKSDKLYRVFVLGKFDDNLDDSPGMKLNGWSFESLLGTEFGTSPEEAVINMT